MTPEQAAAVEAMWSMPPRAVAARLALIGIEVEWTGQDEKSEKVWLDYLSNWPRSAVREMSVASPNVAR